MRRVAKRWLLLSAVALMAGCLHHAAPVPPRPVPPQLPPTHRGPIEPMFAPDLPADLDLPQPPPAEDYRKLTAALARCLAVRGSASGNQLRAEQKSGRGSSDRGCFTRPAVRRQEVHNQILSHAEEEARNQSGGVALDAYYRLAEAEGRTNLARQSLTVLDEMVAVLKEARQGGLDSKEELAALTKQRSELLTSLLQLHIGIEQGNRQMKKFLGLPCPGDPYRIWPCEPMVVVREPIDVPKAIEVGLQQRADLKLLRTLLANLDKKTLPEARLVLIAINPLLGGTPEGEMGGTIRAIGACLNGEELESVRRQIEDLLRDREADVAAEIAERAREIESRLALVLLARSRAEAARERVAVLEEQKASGQPVQTKLQRARLELLKARSELLPEVVGWEIARVQLARAQGLLTLGCDAPAGQGCAPPDERGHTTHELPPAPIESAPSPMSASNPRLP